MLFFIAVSVDNLLQCTMFQYISCYSLSAAAVERGVVTASFNTSHVILYHTKAGYHRYKKRVSIHLMLFFIETATGTRRTFYTFQYISCYSLSLDFPFFSMPIFFIISQNTRICNIFPR